MIGSLTEKQQQLLALVIMVLAITVVAMLTVVPLWAANQHYQNIIEELDGQLEIHQRVVTAGDALRSRHEQLKRSHAGNRNYLKATSEALAAAELQKTVKRIAGTNGMELLSTQILPASKASELTRITLKVRMRGRLDNILRVFYTLETGQPYLFLDNVSVRSQGQRKRTAYTDHPLDVDFNLIGYMPIDS